MDVFNLPYYPIGPATPHNYLVRWRTIWKKCRDVLAGEESVKDAGDQYLPRMARMSDADYEQYKTRALFYGASERTIQGLLGSLLRKPPILKAADEAAEAKLEALLSNITQSGIDLAGFARTLVYEVLATGRVGVLVDMPPIGANLLSPQPYVRMYTAENIINWREHFEGGVPILDQVMLMELIALPSANGFGVQFSLQYRELLLNDDGTYVQRVWVIEPPAEEGAEPTFAMMEEVTPTIRGKPLNHLPFFFCSATHTRPDIDRPPLLDMFNVNLSHYRSSADLEHGRHYVALPTPVVSGVDTSEDGGGAPPSLEIGASTAWLLPVGATARMLEFNGQGLKHLENALTEKTALMVSLGARMLEPDKRASETAEALRLRQAGDIATLNTISDCVSTVLTKAVRLVSWWSNISKSYPDASVSATLDKDYYESRLTPTMLTSLVAAWQGGALSFTDLYYNLIRGETIEASRTLDEVKAEVAAEVQQRLDAWTAAQASLALVKQTTADVSDKMSSRKIGNEADY